MDRPAFGRLSSVLCLLVLALLPWETGGQSDPFGFKSNLQPDGTWELAWNSEAGVAYVLQRSPDLEVWTEVGAVVAVGDETSLTDVAASPEGRTFWRVIRQGQVDGEPPTVSIIEARYVDSGGSTELELLVEATDNIGVVGVVYTGDGVELGAATAGPGSRWVQVVPLDPEDEDPRQFQARAEDAAGNAGFSEIFTYDPGAQLPGFVPIGRDGEPVGGGAISGVADSKLGPFVYLPGGNGGGSLSSAMQLRFPDGAVLVEEGGQTFIEYERMSFGFGEGSAVQVDFEAGKHFFFKANPASLTVLGKDVVPDGQFCLELEADTSTYLARFALDDDFKPLPGVFEIKKGEVALAYNGGGSFGFSMNGGIRVLDLPEGGGLPDWAVDQNVSFAVSSPEFDLSLSTLLGGSTPANLFDSDVFEVDWGDVRIVREPAWGLELNDLNLRVFNNSVATVSGTAGLDGKLSLSGSIGSANNIRLVSNNRFSLRPATGTTADLSLELDMGLNPSLKLDLPSLKLYCSAAEIPSNEMTIPGFSFDSSGAFDTGKIPLPTWDFDGIELSKPSGGKVRDNYIRLERESDGDIFFDAEAEIVFIPGCPLHEISLTVDNTGLDASMRGRFCVLPEAVSLDFNTSGSCQFSTSNSGFTIYFGSGCAGYENNATGICVGDCP